jgi:peptide/nickel transport system substrate-binding protein
MGLQVFAHFMRLLSLNLFVCLWVVACTGGSQPETNLKRIVYGLTLSPSGFDPHRNESSELGIPMRQVYDTLIYRDPETGGFVPGLAREWTISENRLEYTFKLREDVTFHDDTRFNAQAVAANLDRIMNPKVRSTRAEALLGTYVGYRIDDDFTITLILSEAYSPLLDSLSQVYLGIASPKALAEYSPERYQFHQIGTGPYQLVELTLDSHLILKRNPNYTWGPAFYRAADKNAIDEIEYRFFTDAAARFSALETDAAQIMGEIPPLTARSITGSNQFQLIPVTIAGQPLQFFINTRQSPTNNLQFRQALLYGTNRGVIRDVIYQGFSPIAWGPITSNTQFYNPSLEGSYDYDFIQAQRLLAASGYSDMDNNGFLDVIQADAGKIGDLKVTMIVPPWSAIPQVAQLLQEQWRLLGISVILETVPDFPTLLTKVEEGEYHLVPFSTYGIDPAFLNRFFLSTGDRNWTGFVNEELDNALIDGVRQLEPGTRSAAYAKVQQMIMDNALILPIREYVNLNVASATIEGLTFDPYGWFPLMANVRLRDRNAAQ